VRQIVYGQPGAPQVLQLVEVAPVPEPAAGEVLVRVAAAGVNRPDLLQRRGLYPPPPGSNPHLGLEVSGQIVQCGANVSADLLGQAVCALTNGGGYAQFVSVPAVQVMRLPRSLSLIQAAALPETFMTVWSNVFERCALAPNELFLVHAGASSIGLTAIALAKAIGAKVFATAGSESKLAACVQQGADAVFDYNAPNWLEKVKQSAQAFGCRGIDVILDILGGDTLAGNLALLNIEGRLCSIAQLSSAVASVDLTRLMVKRLTITGSTLRTRTTEYKGHLAETLQQRVWPWLESGQIVPVIDSIVPLENVVQAHIRMESRQNIGKIILQVSGN
jgi:NADPH:quinone reductase